MSNSAVEQYNKLLEGGTLGFKDSDRSEARLPSAITSFNYELGGGYIWGSMVEVSGQESVGKTKTILFEMENYLKNNPDGRSVLFIDVEHKAIDSVRPIVQRYGEDRFFYVRPKNAYEAIHICTLMLQTGQIAIVAIDSTTALSVSSDVNLLSRSHDDQTEHSSVLTSACRALVPLIGEQNALCFITSQMRGNFSNGEYISDRVAGPNIFRFASRYRMHLRRLLLTNKGTLDVVGQEVQAVFSKAQGGVSGRANFSINEHGNIITNSMLATGKYDPYTPDNYDHACNIEFQKTAAFRETDTA